MDVESTVCRIVAQIMNVPRDAVTMDSSPDTLEAWDSLKHMNLVLALEQEFNTSFDEEQIVEMLNVALIATIVQDALNGD